MRGVGRPAGRGHQSPAVAARSAGAGCFYPTVGTADRDVAQAGEDGGVQNVLRPDAQQHALRGEHKALSRQSCEVELPGGGGGVLVRTNPIASSVGSDTGAVSSGADRASAVSTGAGSAGAAGTSRPSNSAWVSGRVGTAAPPLAAAPPPPTSNGFIL